MQAVCVASNDALVIHHVAIRWSAKDTRYIYIVT